MIPLPSIKHQRPQGVLQRKVHTSERLSLNMGVVEEETKVVGVPVEVLAKSGVKAIPKEYVRPEDERPNLADAFSTVDVPLIDLSDEKSMAEKLGKAAREWGIFQVFNHGVPRDTMDRVQLAGKEFFELPIEEKDAHRIHDNKEDTFEGYGTKLKCTAHTRQGWSDFYFHMLWPPSLVDVNKWPRHPPSYVGVTQEYGNEIVGVVDKILSGLSCGLGLEKDKLKKSLGGDGLEMEMKINYYPPCPQPEMTLGVLAHTDMCALTVLMPNDVPGLQIHTHHPEHPWVSVRHVPDSFIIHIGDQLQSVSNGEYRSVVHRTLVNKETLRMSWAVFCIPPLDFLVEPIPELLGAENPPRFPAMTYRQFKRKRVPPPKREEEEKMKSA